MGVVDQSLTPQSRAFISSLTENQSFDVAEADSSASERPKQVLNKLRLDMFVVIPPDFAG